MFYSLEIENILGRALLPGPGSLALLLIEPRGGKKGAMNTHSQKKYVFWRMTPPRFMYHTDS